MNAPQFVVLLLIGVLCANVGARLLEEVSKDTKLSISLPKNPTKGLEARDYSVSSNYDSTSNFVGVFASEGPGESYATGNAGDGTYTSGYSYADGPGDESTYSGGGVTGGAGAGASADPDGATSGGGATGTGSSGTGGNTEG